MLETLDIIGAVLAFVTTILYIRINIFAWPLSLIAICIDMFLYLKKGIYGDTALNCIYLTLTLYGWYQWKYGGNNNSVLSTTSLDSKLTLQLLAIAVMGISALFYALSHYTNSQIPFLDASTTILSLIAQWMLCKKIIQCWALWFLVDAVYSGIYFYKGIPAHGVLNIVYLSMAVVGYLSWKKQFSIDFDSPVMQK